jgi:hypothetical protein
LKGRVVLLHVDINNGTFSAILFGTFGSRTITGTIPTRPSLQSSTTRLLQSISAPVGPAAQDDVSEKYMQMMGAILNVLGLIPDISMTECGSERVSVTLGSAADREPSTDEGNTVA